MSMSLGNFSTGRHSNPRSQASAASNSSNSSNPLHVQPGIFRFLRHGSSGSSSAAGSGGVILRSAVAVAAAAGSTRSTRQQQQKQQQVHQVSDIHTAAEQGDVVLSAKHNAPMHPGLLAQALLHTKSRSRGGRPKKAIKQQMPAQSKGKGRKQKQKKAVGPTAVGAKGRLQQQNSELSSLSMSNQLLVQRSSGTPCVRTAAASIDASIQQQQQQTLLTEASDNNQQQQQWLEPTAAAVPNAVTSSTAAPQQPGRSRLSQPANPSMATPAPDSIQQQQPAAAAAANDTAVSVDGMQRRGRGRPRHAIPAAAAGPIAAGKQQQQHQQHKGRGRPPTHAEPDLFTHETGSPQQQQQQQPVLMPVGEANPGSSNTQQQLQQPRSRGRPTSEPVATQVAGAAADSRTHQHATDTSGSEEALLQQGRMGRPQNQPLAAEPAGSTLQLAADAASVAKALPAGRGRGRPPTLGLDCQPAAELSHGTSHSGGLQLESPQQQSSSRTAQQLLGRRRRRQDTNRCSPPVPSLTNHTEVAPDLQHQTVHHHQQQQQQQQESVVPDQQLAPATALGGVLAAASSTETLQEQQVASGDPAAAPDSSSSSDSTAGTLAQVNPQTQGLNGLHRDPIWSGLADSNTEQHRSEMERLYGLPAASIPGMSPLSACSTAMDSSDEGAAAAATHWQQQQERQRWVGPKGFMLSRTVQGKAQDGSKPLGIHPASSPEQQQQGEQPEPLTAQDQAGSSSSSSNNQAPHDHNESGSGAESYHSSLTPPEPSPLEPPTHPEMQDDVQLQEEMGRLHQHQQLLQKMKMGEQQYRLMLSRPALHSLAYLTPDKLDALQAARQLIQEHPELQQWLMVEQQDFAHATVVAKEAAKRLHEVQTMISSLEAILQQEQLRADSLANSSSSKTSSKFLADSGVGNAAAAEAAMAAGADGNAAADALAAAAAAAAADDQCDHNAEDPERIAWESLVQLQQLNGALESGILGGQQQQLLPPPGPGDEIDPHEDYQWG